MRKYILSAMVLVLGLFTVTAVLAVTFKTDTKTSQAGQIVYFDHDNFDQSSDWDNPNAWTETPNTNPECTGLNEILCRIRLDSGQQLQDFLGPISSLNSLMSENQVDLKPENTL